MQHSGNRGVGRHTKPQPQRRRASCFRRWKAVALTGAIAGLLFGFGLPTKAAESNHPVQVVSALRNYVSLIRVEGARAFDVQSANLVGVAALQTADARHAKIGNLRQTTGGALPTSIEHGVKIADADYVVDALRDLLKKKNNTASSQKTKAPPVPSKRHGPAVEANYVGTKVCLGCHTSQVGTFKHTLMGRLLKQGRLQCETCHGPGSEHVRLGGGRGVGGIISFRKDDTSRTAEENNSICLGCHQRGDRTFWKSSPHATRGLACTDCHTIMRAVSRKRQLKTSFEPETCFQCHKDRRMQMLRSSHMPLREGKVVCSDCHNPHGGFTDAMLRTASINDTCYKCHAEKRGPFLFEHPPVRENCLNCHDPHGSVNEYLLKISRPRLCAECHTFDHEENIANGPKLVFGFSRACQNCHNAIHGTNSPGGGLLHR